MVRRTAAKGEITRPAPFVIVTRCADIVHDAETSRRLWELTRTSDTVYNLCLAHLRTHPGETVQTDPKAGRPGLFGMLTHWRAEGETGADTVPVGIARGAAAQAHAAYQRWDATQAEHAKAVLAAAEEAKPILRRVQHAKPSVGPRWRKRKEREREGRCALQAIAGVRRTDDSTRRFTVGGVELRTAKPIGNEGTVVSAQVLERTPQRLARAGCAPQDRTWKLHVQMRVAVATGPEVKRVRAERKMRDVHDVDGAELVAGVAALDAGVTRAVTVALPNGACRHVTSLDARQRAQAERGYARARKMARGTRRARPGQHPSRRRRDAHALRTRTTRRVERRRRARVATLAKNVVSHRAVRAVVLDAVQWETLGRTARGTQEAPGAKVAPKRGLSRALKGAAPGETNALFARAAARAGRWTIEGNPYATSTTCAACGHRAKESRESQAVFRCVACAAQDHADDNAARVAQQRGQRRLGAYLGAIAAHQRREGVAPKHARGRCKHVPVLHVLDTTPKPNRGEPPQRSPQGSARATEQLSMSV